MNCDACGVGYEVRISVLCAMWHHRLHGVAVPVFLLNEVTGVLVN